MIKINLATRRQQAGDHKALKGGAGGAAQTLGILKDLPIRKVALPLMVGFVASYLLDGYKEEQIKKQDVVLTRLNKQGADLTAEAGKTQSYEPLKKALDQDEAMIKTKLDTITKLVADRSTTHKFLFSISNAIPADAWLSELRVDKTDVILKGGALGFTQISDFLKNLNENSFFASVELKNTEQQEKEPGSETATFELKAKRR